MAIVEAGREERAPIFKQYGMEVPITRPFSDPRPEPPLDAFTTEAHRHPVFRVMEKTDEGEGKK